MRSYAAHSVADPSTMVRQSSSNWAVCHRSSRQPRRAHRIVEQVGQRVAQIARVPVEEDRVVAILQKVGDGGIAGHKHRHAARERLQVHQSQRVHLAREDERSCRGIELA